MAQRLFAFALAFVFAAAPVAGEICEARCAGHAGHAIAHEAVASHHHHTSDSALTLNALSRSCVQLDAVVNESRDVLRRPMVSAVASTTSVPVITMAPWRSNRARRQHGPAVPTRSISQLRI
jgi:hypothetical protein